MLIMAARLPLRTTVGPSSGISSSAPESACVRLPPPGLINFRLIPSKELSTVATTPKTKVPKGTPGQTAQPPRFEAQTADPLHAVPLAEIASHSVSLVWFLQSRRGRGRWDGEGRRVALAAQHRGATSYA
jgi:hypothetical protein